MPPVLLFYIMVLFCQDGPKTDGKPETISASTCSAPAPKKAKISATPDIVKDSQEPVKVDPEVEKKVLMVLCDINLDIPCNAAVIADHTTKALGRGITLASIEVLLQNFASQQLIRFG